MLKTRSCFNFIWIVIIFFSLTPCGLHAQTEKETGPDVYYQDFEEFITIIKEIQNKYVDVVDLKTLLRSGYTGMLGSLDPYSQYIGSKHLEELRIETGGVFEGLGIEIVIKDDILTVLTPIVDSPAFRAGVFIGDKIIKIDGKSTKPHPEYPPGAGPGPKGGILDLYPPPPTPISSRFPVEDPRSSYPRGIPRS